jgi:hypothetical protein
MIPRALVLRTITNTVRYGVHSSGASQGFECGIRG